MAAAASLAGPAASAAAEIPFAIPEQARQAALLDLARQAGLSLGFAPDADCRGRAGVQGRMSVETALARLLADSGCEARRPDARTVVIRPTRRPPAPTVAAPAPDPSEAQLAEVVVTAEKTERLLSQTTSALTAATGADLARAGVAEVSDLSLLAAGVTVTNLGPGRDKVILRGLSDGPLTGHTQSTVGLYLGDLRLTYNAPDPDLPLADLARIEVLRGPQGSLYGAGSIGGVLHLVPRRPDPDAAAGDAAVTLGGTRYGAPSYALQATYNQPLPGRDAAVRLVAWSDLRGGVIDDPQRRLTDVDRTRRLGFRASGLWRVSGQFELEAMLVDQNIDTRDARYADQAVGPFARASRIAQPHDNDFLAASVGARWSPAWGSVTATLGALDHDVGTTYDATAAVGAPAMPRGAAPRAFRDNNEIRAVVAETRAASSGTGRWRWTLGAFASIGDQRLDGQITSADGGVGYDEARRDRLWESALFGEASLDLTPQLTATAGGRVFEARLRTRSEIVFTGAARAFRGRSQAGGFAPKVVLAYRPAQDLTLYVQAAEGYRTPGFNTAGPQGQVFSDVGGPQPLRRYAGDELWSYELGARWRSAELGLSARAAVFRAKWTDIQADLLLPSGLPYTSNLGDGVSRGLEAEGAWRTGPLRLSGTFVAQEPELTRSASGLQRLEVSLPGVPKLSYSAAADYAAWTSGDWSVDLHAAYAYVGRSSLPLGPGVAPGMGGYGDVRLAAKVSSPRTDFRIAIDNLLDRAGDTLAFGGPFAGAGERPATPQTPRTVSATIARRF